MAMRTRTSVWKASAALSLILAITAPEQLVSAFYVPVAARGIGQSRAAAETTATHPRREPHTNSLGRGASRGTSARGERPRSSRRARESSYSAGPTR